MAQRIFVDFEEGPSWDYNDYFSNSSFADNWEIVSNNPYAGTYCAHSIYQGAGALNCSLFLFGLQQGSTECFIRSRVRFAGTFYVQTGDDRNNNWIRFLDGGSAVGEYALLYYTGDNDWLYIYGDYTRGMAPFAIRDNLWHELAWYFNFSSGIFRCWRDNPGTYLPQDCLPGYNLTDINTSQWAGTDSIWWGFYTKRALGGQPYYDYWVDNWEYYDSMPDPMERTGSGSLAIPLPSFSGVAHAPIIGTGGLSLPKPSVSGVGSLSRTYLLDRFDGYGSS